MGPVRGLRYRSTPGYLWVRPLRDGSAPYGALRRDVPCGTGAPLTGLYPLLNRSPYPSSMTSRRKLTGRKPSLQEIIADLGFFIQPS